MARNPQGFGGAWRVRSGRPGGVGLDDPAGTDGEPKGAMPAVLALPFVCAMQLHLSCRRNAGIDSDRKNVQEPEVIRRQKGSSRCAAGVLAFPVPQGQRFPGLLSTFSLHSPARKLWIK